LRIYRHKDTYWLATGCIASSYGCYHIDRIVEGKGWSGSCDYTVIPKEAICIYYDSISLEVPWKSVEAARCDRSLVSPLGTGAARFDSWAIPLLVFLGLVSAMLFALEIGRILAGLGW